MFADKIPKWLESEAKNADIIISTRIRLARNFDSIPFPNWAPHKSLRKVIRLALKARSDSTMLKEFDYFNINSISNINRKILVERHLVSPAFLNLNHGRGVFIEKNEESSVMLNEEDHLRIQTICGGLALTTALIRIRKLEEEFNSIIRFSYSKKYGYLTSCPTNVGTGMRISLFCHLPALTLTERLGGLFNDMLPAGMAVRGFFGEGSDLSGTIFQISNQITLGFTENEILDRLRFIARKVVYREKQAREQLFRNQRILIEDKIFRALGIIQGARHLPMFEFYSLLSALKLGKAVGLIQKISTPMLNKLIVTCQPMHIQRLHSKKMSRQDIDIYRARLVRKELNLKRIN